MKGSLFLSLRVGADKRDWALKSGRNVCTGYIFVKILSPQKEGPRRLPKGARGRGPGEGEDRGRRFHEGMAGLGSASDVHGRL